VKVASREKKVIIIGACIAVVVLVLYVVMPLLPDRDNLAQSVERKKRTLRNYRETMGREEMYKRRLEHFQKQLDQNLTRFLAGDNATLAGSELQKVIKDCADQSGVEIIQRSILPEKKVQDIVTKVSVRIETSCTPEQLVQFLASIENYEKMLNVDEIMISAIRLPRKYEIRPSLMISGFIRTQPEKPKEKAPAKPGATNVS
jgi:type II secretory pathway component PulM